MTPGPRLPAPLSLLLPCPGLPACLQRASRRPSSSPSWPSSRAWERRQTWRPGRRSAAQNAAGWRSVFVLASTVPGGRGGAGCGAHCCLSARCPVRPARATPSAGRLCSAQPSCTSRAAQDAERSTEKRSTAQRSSNRAGTDPPAHPPPAAARGTPPPALRLPAAPSALRPAPAPSQCRRRCTSGHEEETRVRQVHHCAGVSPAPPRLSPSRREGTAPERRACETARLARRTSHPAGHAPSKAH